MTASDGKANRTTTLFALAILTLPMASCDTPTQIYGAEIAAYLARVSVDDVIAIRVPGSPPLASDGPSVSAPPSAQVITGGSSQVALVGSDDFQSIAVVVDGVDGYYLITLPEMVTSAAMILTIGNLLPSLDFDYGLAVAGADGNYGAYSMTSVNALKVIGGDIQVSVTWTTLADVDLHVIDPNGEEIYYSNRRSASGGELDLDANAACSTSNIFQENIGWSRNTASSGTYKIRVDYWDACGATETDFVVTLSIRPGLPLTPITPRSALRTFSRRFTGPGTHGGAGAGTTITISQF